MKKLLTLFAFGISLTSLFGQDLTSKKGEPILPEAGDWSIGIDATSFLNYIGNFFGKTTANTAPTFSFLTSNQTITGKYFKDAKTAYRASLRLGFLNTTTKETERDRSFVPTTPNNYPNSNPLIENSWHNSLTNIGLSLGLEKRKGKTRLQGYYGAEAGIGLTTSKDKFNYGNALNPNPAGTATAVIVSADDQITGANNYTTTIPVDGIVGGARVTERKNGTSFTFGARAFIGVEYFLFAKLSLGGEFGWGLGFRTGSKTTTTYESVGNKAPTIPTSTRGVGSTDIVTPRGGSIKLDTDNTNSMYGASGSLRLNFYF